MHRLSFSRAEIVLLNSWMPVQQIVYHMLRTFVKTEKITEVTDNFGSKIFSNYHIKTIMLWACEQKPKTWWNDDLRLVKICVELLHALAMWFSHRCCPHHFIRNCNLLDITCDTKAISSQLMSVSESWLAFWFINNYIYKCAQMCPKYVPRLLDNIITVGKLQNAVSAIVYWRKSNELEDLWMAYDLSRCFVTQNVYRYPSSVRSCVCWMTELTKSDKTLSLYFIDVVFLYVAMKLSNNGIYDGSKLFEGSYRRKLFDILATIVGQFIGVCTTQRHCSRHSSVFLLDEVAELMKVLAYNSRSTVQLIRIELSKAYLHRASRRKDSNVDAMSCVVNVYLGVLYYATGQYQTAIYHFKQLDISQDHSQSSSHVVQGELLPKIDDDVDNWV